MSVPIAAITILAILATAIFLLSFYIFLIKCPSSSSSPSSSTTTSSSRSTGLASTTIRSIPTSRFSPTTFSHITLCSVCLSDFLSGQLLRTLPLCSHSFHVDCIDAWLHSNTTCPLCRSPITSHHINPIQSVVVEVSGEGMMSQRRRRFARAVSLGDERVQITSDKDEFFAAQPLRRSLSLDSSRHPLLGVSNQEALRRNPSLVYGGDGRVWRSLFSLGRSRSAVQPL